MKSAWPSALLKTIGEARIGAHKRGNRVSESKISGPTLRKGKTYPDQKSGIYS